MNEGLRICSAKVFFWSTCAAIWIFGNPIRLQPNLTFNLLTKYHMLQLQPGTLQKQQRAYWHYFNICLVFFFNRQFWGSKWTHAEEVQKKNDLKKIQGNIKRKTHKYIIVNESRFPMNFIRMLNIVKSSNNWGVFLKPNLEFVVRALKKCEERKLFPRRKEIFALYLCNYGYTPAHVLSVENDNDDTL